MRDAQLPLPMEDQLLFRASAEPLEPTGFTIFPYDESLYSDGELATVRAITASTIKESLQNFARLDVDQRESRSQTLLSEYTWAILSELHMTNLGSVGSLLPNEEYRQAFAAAYEKGSTHDLSIGDLLDKHEDHPALSFVDTLQHISPKSDVYRTAIIKLRRTLLILLDEYGH